MLLFPAGYYCYISSFLNCPETHSYFKCFYWQTQSDRKGIICYDFGTPTKLLLFVYFIRASRRCSAEMGACKNTSQPTANLCYCYGYPLFMDPSIFKTIEIPSHLKNKRVESVLSFHVILTANKAVLNLQLWIVLLNSRQIPTAPFFCCSGTLQSAEQGIESSCLILCMITFRKKGPDVPKINFLIMHKDETDSLPVDNSLWWWQTSASVHQKCTKTLQSTWPCMREELFFFHIPYRLGFSLLF